MAIKKTKKLKTKSIEKLDESKTVDDITDRTIRTLSKENYELKQTLTAVKLLLKNSNFLSRGDAVKKAVSEIENLGL